MVDVATILKPYRLKIDDLDDQIIDLLGARLAVIEEVSVIKAEQGIEPVLQERVDEVRNRCVQKGVAQGYDAKMMYDLYTLIIDYSCQLEEKVAQKKVVSHDE